MVSIYTYNPNDPGIGRLFGNSEITNFFGFWGAIFSSILLTLYGKVSFLLVIFISYISIFLILGLNLKRPFLKIFLIILSVTFINISLLLQQDLKEEVGLVAKIIFDIYGSYFPFLVDEFLYRLLSIIFFTLIAIILFLYCFSIKINFLRIIF